MIRPSLWARGGRELSLTSNSAALIAANVARLSLGFVFWVLAARFFPARDVGLAAAVVAAMMLCLLLGLLGLGSATIAVFPAHRRSPSALLNTSFVVVAGVAGASALAYLAVAWTSSVALRGVVTTPGYALLFVIACVANTLAGHLDHVSTALRRADQAVIRGLLFGATALAFLVVGHRQGRGDEVIFAAWAVGGVAICALGFAQLRRTAARWRPRLAADAKLARRLVGIALPNHFLTLADRTPGLLLPVLVTALLSPTANATWYVVWMMAGAIYIIPVEVGVTMFSEVAQRPAALRSSVIRGMLVSLGFGLLGGALIATLAPAILQIMGKGYASAGIAPLRILLLAIIPMTVVQAYFAAARARGELREVIVSAWIGGGLSVLAAAFAGAASGLLGMAFAWLGVQCLLGAWAAIRLRGLVRGHAPHPTRQGAMVAHQRPVASAEALP